MVRLVGGSGRELIGWNGMGWDGGEQEAASARVEVLPSAIPDTARLVPLLFSYTRL